MVCQQFQNCAYLRGQSQNGQLHRAVTNGDIILPSPAISPCLNTLSTLVAWDVHSLAALFFFVFVLAVQSVGCTKNTKKTKKKNGEDVSRWREIPGCMIDVVSADVSGPDDMSMPGCWRSRRAGSVSDGESWLLEDGARLQGMQEDGWQVQGRQGSAGGKEGPPNRPD